MNITIPRCVGGDEADRRLLADVEGFRLDKLEFVSKYANVRREFQLSELEGLIDSLPKAVWDGGKIVAIQGTGQKNQADYKRMFEIMGEIEKRLRAKGFRILPTPCC